MGILFCTIGGRRFLAYRFARENTTKANSPPCERRRPVRTLSERLSPTRGPIAVMMAVLIAISPNRSAKTLGHSRSNNCTSHLTSPLDGAPDLLMINLPKKLSIKCTLYTIYLIQNCFRLNHCNINYYKLANACEEPCHRL